MRNNNARSKASVRSDSSLLPARAVHWAIQLVSEPTPKVSHGSSRGSGPPRPGPPLLDPHLLPRHEAPPAQGCRWRPGPGRPRLRAGDTGTPVPAPGRLKPTSPRTKPNPAQACPPAPPPPPPRSPRTQSSDMAAPAAAPGSPHAAPRTPGGGGASAGAGPSRRGRAE